jgi:hypothetical protein
MWLPILKPISLGGLVRQALLAGVMEGGHALAEVRDEELVALVVVKAVGVVKVAEGELDRAARQQ